METTCYVSSFRRRMLEIQGIKGYSDQNLYDFRFGLRFAYFLCASLVLLGLILSSVYILAFAMIVAFFGMFPPYHPNDYLYNYVIRHFLHKPKIPPRTNQGRFACGIATVWLAGIIYLFSIGLSTWAYIAGAILLVIAALVSTMDICIPSMIYNFLFLRKGKR